MNTNHRDPTGEELKEARLTAYALGQLEAQQRSQVEAELAASQQAQRAVEATRAVAEHVREAARREVPPEPSPTLRAEVEERLQELEAAGAAGPTRKSPRRRLLWCLVALAACLLIAAFPIYSVFEGHSNWHRESGDIAMYSSRGGPSAAATKRPPSQPLVAIPKTEVAESTPVMPDPARSSRNLHKAEGIDLMSETPPRGAMKVPNAPEVSVSRSYAPPRAASEKEKTSQRFASPRFDGENERIPGLNGEEFPEGPSAMGPGASPGYPTPGGYPMPGFDAMGSMMPGWPAPKPPSPAEKPAAPAEKPAGTAQAPGAYPGSPSIGGPGMGPMPQSVDHDVEASRYNALNSRYFGPLYPTPGDQPPVPGTEQYERTAEDDFRSVNDHPLSTFSIDVDTASYSNVRRFLREGRLPPPEAVRVEEMINYFTYHYPQPEAGQPFSVNVEVAECPWNPGHRLVRIGLRGRDVPRNRRGPCNLVFLLDVSGSMSDEDKLPLVKRAMKMLVENLGENDRVAIVVYADDARLHLASTNGAQKARIMQAIDALDSNGSTNGGAGIQLAYQQAAEHFIAGGTNRVILATDGDLNVGITDDNQLVRLIRDKAKTGVFLTVLGVGTGNLKDAKLEKLADRGNGTYAYLDSLREARRVLVEQMSGSLVTIAKDVKVQIEFNPAKVLAYRQVGYENRRLAARDFNNDRKDAGEIGAGHTVTALYELVPVGGRGPAGDGGPLRYQRVPDQSLTAAAQSGEVLLLKLRYKQPDAQESKLLQYAVKDSGKRFGQASTDFRFAAAVASFGMLLRNSRYAGTATLAGVEEIAAAALGDDPGGYRAELVDLVRGAEQLRR